MKKIISSLLVLAMLTALIFSFGANAVSAVTTDKIVYDFGEDILVTAYGANADWVGIYLSDDVIPADESIYWYYVARDGNTSGSTVNIKNATYTNPSRSAYFTIPAGSYKIILFENDGYTQLASVSITVRPAQASAPASAVYTRTTSKAGFADGTLSITAPSSGEVVSYIVYWADASGALPGYEPFPPVAYSGGTTVMTIQKNVIIPSSATRLIVYSENELGRSASFASAPLPAGAVRSDWGELRAEFNVISDTHIRSSASELYNQHLQAALADIKAISPGCDGVYIVGDITDNGLDAEYTNFKNIMSTGGFDYYACVGNHDLVPTPYSTALARFNTALSIQTTLPYYDMWKNGIHYIFLGSEASGTDATLSQTQLLWLSQKLAENRDESRPIFLFLHQSLADTVAGSFGYQGWDGVTDAAALTAVLRDFPEIIMFNGHSHWQLSSPNTMYIRSSSLPTVFNTSAVAYLWNDDCIQTNTEIVGSEGYYVRVYDNYTLVLGRSFSDGAWLPEAQFVVENVLIPGDANVDGEVNGKDLVRLKKYIADPDVTINLTSADINGDGLIGVGDIAAVLNLVKVK